MSPTATGTTPTVTPTTPPPGGACTATYRVVSQWTDVFQGEVTVRNDTTRATSTWTATRPARTRENGA